MRRNESPFTRYFATPRLLTISFLFSSSGFLLPFALADEPKNPNIVLQVRIDNNSQPPAAGTSAAGFSGLNASDECEALRQKIINLENQLGNRIDRSKLATALATVKMQIVNNSPLIFVDGDEFEVLSVKFLEGNNTGALQWTPLPADDANGGSGNAFAPSAENAGAELPSNGSSSPGTTPTAPPVDERKVIIKLQDNSTTIESSSPAGRQQLRLQNGQFGLMLPSQGGLVRFQVKANGISQLTYQQPTAPWTLIYEQEGGTLHQWVKYSNFTGHDWSPDTKVILSDLFSSKDNRNLEFKPKQTIPSRSSAIQLLNEFPIKEESYALTLGDGNSQSSKTITLDFTGYMPSGEFRDLVESSYQVRTAKVKEAASNQVRIENEPSLLAIKRKFNKVESQTVGALAAGRFQIDRQRTSQFLLRNSGDVRTVKISKPIDSDWAFEGTDWKKEDSDYVKTVQVSPGDQSVQLVERGEETLNFNDPTDQAILAKIAEGFSDTVTGLDAVLISALDFSKQVARREMTIARLTKEIDELTTKYNAYDVGNDLTRDEQIRRLLKGIWERMNFLKSERAIAEDEKVGFELQLNTLLYPATDS